MQVRAVIVVVALAGSLLAAGPHSARAEQSGSEERRVAAAAIAVGEAHSCVLTTAGRVRCWGLGEDGRLGYGNTVWVGDNEAPAVAGDVPLGGRATAIAAGDRHTCALMTTGQVRCWGDNERGQLGQGDTADVGGSTVPSDAPPIALGRRAVAITAGGSHTCALLDNRRLRCWGAGDLGQLGHGDGEDVGDDETVVSAGFVPGTGYVRSVSAGTEHTCVVRVNRAVRCWGEGFAGRLGYGDEVDRGDDEAPFGDVPLGGPAVALSAGWLHTCVVLTGARVRCFGRGLHGRLGYGDGLDVGNDETPASVGDVDLDAPAASVAAGGEHTCVVTRTEYLRCFGRSLYGQLGYGNDDSVGDDEPASAVGNVPTIDRIVAVDAGADHTCALTRSGHARCWGRGQHGRLGHDGTDDIGDFEPAHDPGRLDVGAGVQVRAVVGLTPRVGPRRDRSAPFRITAATRLGGRFVPDAATCHGQVVVEVRRPRGRLVARRVVAVDPTCRSRAVVVLPASAVPPGWTALRVRATFRGTPDLRRATAQRVVRVLR